MELNGISGGRLRAKRSLELFLEGKTLPSRIITIDDALREQTRLRIDSPEGLDPRITFVQDQVVLTIKGYAKITVKYRDFCHMIA